MKVSVVVPVYGVEKYIARCAESLLNQDYEDKELIFVDDASPDESMTILQELLLHYPSQQVTLLRHSINRGLAAARKTGMAAARGEYVVHVDSDDYLEPNALTVLAAKAQETGADIIGMDFYFDWGNKKKIYRGRWAEDAQAYCQLVLSGATMPNMWSHMMRKELIERAGVQPIIGLDTGEDYLFVSKICTHARSVAHVKSPLYHYMQTNDSSFMHVVSEKNIRSLIQVMNELSDFFARQDEYTEALRAGQWMKKTELMLRVPKKWYALVDQMPAEKPIVYNSMSIAQRLAAPLVAQRYWLLLSLYGNCYSRLINMLQVLKGRRKC
ncbi:MAG: glycosyltransferase [Paludibacteraceae bacterium]|nr:glycosyltransferase [Paludibacteraceae bacterium]